jgi:hypothetical protein
MCWKVGQTYHLFLTGKLSIRRMDGQTESSQDLHLLNKQDKELQMNQSKMYTQKNIHREGEAKNGEQNSRKKTSINDNITHENFMK